MIIQSEKKKWISAGKRPIVTVTAGSRKRTIVFGCLSTDGRQLFLQYDKFNTSKFVDYLKQVQKRFGKIVIFVDRAKPHCSNQRLQKDSLILIRIPSD